MTAILAALVLAFSPAQVWHPPVHLSNDVGLVWHQGQPKTFHPVLVRPHRVPGWHWSH